MKPGCPEPLVAVGKPCDCGHPLVWVRGSQRCAVYGTHPTPDDRVTFRNLQAPGVDLVNLILANTGRRKRQA